MCVCVFVSLSRINRKARRARKLKICIQGYLLTATTVYWFLRRNFGMLTSLDKCLRYNSHSFYLINLKIQLYIEYIVAHLHTNMVLLRHQTNNLEIYVITQLQMVVAIPNITWIRNQRRSFYLPIHTQIQQDLHTKF